MKADLTLPENRSAFASQYIYQDVVLSENGFCKLDTSHIKNIFHRQDHVVGPLCLRHISSLTEEEKVALSKHMGVTGARRILLDNAESVTKWLIEDDMEIAGNIHWSEISDAIDFLRSISVLLPWRGNSCEEIIRAGLAVYRKEKEDA